MVMRSSIATIVIMILSFSLIATSAFAGKHDNKVTAINAETEHYMHTKNYSRAIASCNKALGLDPDNVAALNQRIVLFSLMNAPEKARADLDKLIAIAKTPADKAASIAYKYKYFGQNTEAKAEIDKAIKLEPKNPHFYADRADILVKLKQFDAALKDANKAIELDAKFYGAYFARARIYEAMGDNEKSKEDFKTAEKLKDTVE